MEKWGWLGMATSLITKLKSLFKVFKPKKKKIRKYCGISKQPYLKEEEHKKNFPSLHNWRVVVKFKNQAYIIGEWL